MKSMVRLLEVLITECAQETGIDASRDIETIMSRLEHEGLSFITIALPEFEKDVLSSIEHGQIAPTSFSRFKRESNAERPIFLGAFLAVIFKNNGWMRTDNPADQIVALRAIRQILLFVSKVEFPTTRKRVKKAISQYVSTDMDIPELPEALINELRETCDYLYGDLFSDVEKEFYKEFPSRHSSGSLATRESYNSRFASRVWTDRLQEVLPSWDFLDVNWRHNMDEPVQYLSSSEEPGCRVFTVPKTMKSPRIIAMEPAYNNLVQQGVLQTINSTLCRNKYKMLRSMLYWDDQGRNQKMAQEGSVHGNLCTIDLSEASDRVGLSLVRDCLLGNHGFLRSVALASRSEKAELPDGTIVPLKKFASMGSALTFPFETMVFFAICLQGFWKSHYRISVDKLEGSFAVYGDDIVVPTNSMSSVIQELEAYGLKVNLNKSFGQGLFRESCGGDYFRGGRVNPVRLRSSLPGDTRCVPETVVRSVDLHNRLYNAGYFESARELAAIIRRETYVPYGPVGSSGISLWTFEDSLVQWRFNKNLHRPEFKVLIPKNVKPIDELSGWGALRKYFLMRGSYPLEEGHLERDGRSQCVKLIIGWTEQLKS